MRHQTQTWNNNNDYDDEKDNFPLLLWAGTNNNNNNDNTNKVHCFNLFLFEIKSKNNIASYRKPVAWKEA